MKRHRGLRVVRVVGMVALALGAFGLATEYLWNGIMPHIFGLKKISFAQALGLLVLSKILFGGFHRHAGAGRGWRRHMQERWAQMSPEERERFQAGMRKRGCRFDPASELATEQHPV